MTVKELIEKLSTLNPNINVLVETEDSTLNEPVFEHHPAEGGLEFLVLALPSPYDTYNGPISKF